MLDWLSSYRRQKFQKSQKRQKYPSQKARFGLNGAKQLQAWSKHLFLGQGAWMHSDLNSQRVLEETIYVDLFQFYFRFLYSQGMVLDNKYRTVIDRTSDHC